MSGLAQGALADLDAQLAVDLHVRQPNKRNATLGAIADRGSGSGLWLVLNTILEQWPAHATGVAGGDQCMPPRLLAPSAAAGPRPSPAEVPVDALLLDGSSAASCWDCSS
eukprot:9005836-Pyramimonas_sp.AAC.2